MAITLKPAGPEDADIVLALRNEPDIRRWFLNPEPVAPEVHANWYRETLAGTRRRLYLVIEDGAATPIGYVRFDRIGQDVAEVSLAIFPGRRGRGYGKDALIQACRCFRQAERVTRIVARILAENKISMTTFRDAGFVIVSSDSLEGNPGFVLELAGLGVAR